MRRAPALLLLAAALFACAGCDGGDDGESATRSTDERGTATDPVATAPTAADEKRSEKPARTPKASRAERRALRRFRGPTSASCLRVRDGETVAGPRGAAGLRPYLRETATVLDRTAAEVARGRPPKSERAAVDRLERLLRAGAGLYRSLRDRPPDADLVRLTEVIEGRIGAAAAAVRLPACSPF